MPVTAAIAHSRTVALMIRSYIAPDTRPTADATRHNSRRSSADLTLRVDARRHRASE